jgi:hypothetical protein
MGYGLDGRGSIPAGPRDFSLLNSVQTGSGATQPPIQWAKRVLSLAVKRPGREADYLSQSSAEVKNGGAILPLPHMSS